MDTLRQMAMEEGYAPDPAVFALHQSFLDSIKLWGRVHELSMLMEYKTRCLLAEPSLFFHGLVQDMKMGADLALKGKLSFIPERVKRLAEIKRLYDEAGEHLEGGR
jgi:heterodisulfide reductase subunit C